MHSMEVICVKYGVGREMQAIGLGGVLGFLVVDTLAISCTSRDTSTERIGELLLAIAK